MLFSSIGAYTDGPVENKYSVLILKGVYRDAVGGFWAKTFISIFWGETVSKFEISSIFGSDKLLLQIIGDEADMGFNPLMARHWSDNTKPPVGKLIRILPFFGIGFWGLKVIV